MPEWLVIVVVVASLALVISVVRLIDGWRYRREIARLNEQLFALNAHVSTLNARVSALNARGHNVGRDSGVLTGLVLSVALIALMVWLVVVPLMMWLVVVPLREDGTSTQAAKQIENGTHPENVTHRDQDQQSGRQQKAAEAVGVLQQLRMIMERLKLTIMEQWNLTGASAFELPNKPHQIPKPVLVHRPYHSCCCPPNYYYRHYDYYR
jgi:tetrahydromethanopterin S-methyltransferase subunit G